MKQAPLTRAQERLWFLSQLDPHDAAYNMYLVRRLRGPLETAALSAALDEIVARHETLRTRFGEVDGRAGQEILSSAPVRLELIDLTAVRDERREAVARRLVGARTNTPFDLAAAPPVRASLIRLTGADHVLCVTLHHIVSDGWSVQVFGSELAALYNAFTSGAPSPLAPLPIQYADYARRERERDDDAGALAYWRSQLADLPQLELLTDRTRPRARTSHGDMIWTRIPAGLTQQVRRLAREERVTLFTMLLTAYQVLLFRYTGQSDICIGVPVAGRDDVDTEPLIGYFSRTLVLRGDLSGGLAFRELLRRTRGVLLQALSHQDIPYEQLIAEMGSDRDIGQNPFFQTMFTMQDTGTVADPDGSAFDGISDEPFDPGYRQAKFDLLVDVWPDGTALGASFCYNTDLFDRATVQQLAARWEILLAAAVAHPELPAAGLPLLAQGELGLLQQWADGGRIDPAASVLDLVDAAVARAPAAPAIVSGSGVVSYAELSARAAELAAELHAGGVRPGDIVGIRLPRSAGMIAVLLAVWRNGAAYVPVDPDLPPARVSAIIADTGITAMMTPRGVISPPGSAPAPDGQGPLPGRHHAPGIAYVIYTSGSAGRPKGVLVGHAALAARVAWMVPEYQLGPGDRVVQFASLSFDTHAEEIWSALAAGATLVLLPEGPHSLPDVLRDDPGITVLDLPTAYWHQLVALGGDICWPTGLRLVIIGGEQADGTAVAAWCSRGDGQARLVNTYGPTEATVVSTWADLTGSDAADGARRPPIGRPVAGARVYVTGEDTSLVPAGVPGELCIGGAGLATGYLGRPALTAERFVPDRSGGPGGRLYRTGDRVRWRPDGMLEFLGRLDDQLKVRGHRIEPAEVESALRSHPAVSAVAVTARDDALVAYVAGRAEPAQVRAHVAGLLPAYMVPDIVVPVRALPLNRSGKVDLAALPAPETRRIGGVAFTAPRTEREKLVAGVWAEILGVERIGIDDNFFALGGHSLLATQVIARLRRLAGAGVSVPDLFKSPTVRQLAALTQTPADGGRRSGLLCELTPPAAGGQTVLSFVCVPYGGGSAVAYQPLADALPPGHRLFAVAIPGHDVGLDEQAVPLDELADRCVTEIGEKIPGPVAVYGHSGVGSALAVEIARRLEGAGREVEAVYLGAVFPFARPKGRMLNTFARLARMEVLRSDRIYANWLTSMGVNMSELGDVQARQIIRNMRRDTESAEAYFSDLFAAGAARLAAPIVTIAGDRDPSTDYYQERFREWHFLTDTTAMVVLDEAGHFFLKYRAGELADIVTRAHRALHRPGSLSQRARGPHAGWWLHGVSQSPEPVRPTGPQPGMYRFLSVAAGQLVSATGSALTEFAVPLWIYLRTGSLAKFALLAVCGLIPGLLVAPLAGAIVDRVSRRRVMLLGDVAAGSTQLMFGILLWTGQLRIWEIYLLLVSLSLALTFQRLAYNSAVPQLVPKRYLGHANGVVQLSGGAAQVLVPLVAVGLLATIGLPGILGIDIGSYAFAICVTSLVRFPATMAWHRRESVTAEIAGGLRHSWGNPGFRAMLVFFALLNVFLSPLLLMITPLVLSFGSLSKVAEVSLAGGLGVALGGLTLSVWGGPRHYRMRGMLLCTLALAACAAVTGLRPVLAVVAIGAFGMALWLTLLNGIYATIVQVKVAQRFHGRVFALNTVIAWSTLPLGWAVVAPYGSRLLGIGPMYIVFALAIAILVAVSSQVPALARFDTDMPDAMPDDLVGVEVRRRHLTATAHVKEM
ncbi:MAG: amino acid adenylation domain-containing protein [Streptosporangiaceae bacterium]